MAIIEIAGWTVDVDVPTTRAYYANRPTWAETCGCAYCKNFVIAYDTGRFPAELRSTLKSLGIDPPRDVGEIWQYVDHEYGTHSYGGFYHVVGTIVSDNPNPEDCSVDDGVHLSFSTILDLLSDNFPQPAVQVEFVAKVPWVLPESNAGRQS